jgi:hypothetical protein
VGSLATSGERQQGTSGPLYCQKVHSNDNDFAFGTSAFASDCLRLSPFESAFKPLISDCWIESLRIDFG